MQISRSEQKRRVKEVEQLVVELSKLPDPVLNRCPCSPELVEQLKETSRLKGGAKKRLLKYITKQMKTLELDDIYQFISKQKGNRLQQNKDFHEVEYMRDSLLNEALAEKKRHQQEELEWTETWQSKVAQTIEEQLPDVDSQEVCRRKIMNIEQ